MKTNRELYQQAFRALRTFEDFEVEAMTMNDKKRRFPKHMLTRAAVIACAFLLCTGTAIAAARFLSPAQTAHDAGDQKLEAAFQSPDAVSLQETQRFPGYEVTLLGMVSGSDLSDGKVEADDGEFHDDRTYIVVAIEQTDGGDISFDDAFFVSPLIDGYSQTEVNIATLVGGYTEMISDDQKILYHIADMDNIEPFADHTIRLGVQDGGFFSEDANSETAFLYDEATGTYSRNEAYTGVNALFTLPVDPAKADPEKARRLLSDITDDDHEDDIDDREEDVRETAIRAWADALTPENIEENARPVEGTAQTLIPETNGTVHVRFELPDGAGGEVTEQTGDLFPDGTPGMSEALSYFFGDDGVVYIETFTLHEDGSVTFEIYTGK